MKKIMLISMWSVFTLGSSNARIMDSALNVDNLLLSEKEAFLTSFMEGDRLYLNIPEEVMNKSILMVRYDQSYERKYLQVAWSQHQDKILLKVPSIHSTAGIILPLIPKLVLDESILAVFPLVKGNDNTNIQTIDITDFVLRQQIEWSRGFTESLVPQISLIMDAKNFDNEVIIKTRRGVVKDGTNVSIPVYLSFSAMDGTMKARRFDYRMGFSNEKYFSIKFGDKNSIANISKWQLEKKFKEQKISVPVKPITFLMSPEIPKKWRPYVKAGIEEWLSAFESAGFKDALVVKEVDSLTEWQIHSIDNNIVFWGQKKYLRGSENEVYGGTVSLIVDERSGEILKGDIHLGASPENLEDRYFIRASPLDQRAQKFPFPDELIGEMYQSLAAHEAGHVFGIKDGNFGENSYPTDKMNDREWLEVMGHTPSIMNYARPNNLPRPEDSIPPTLLLQKVGPADSYTIKWAYMEFPPDTTPEDEEIALEELIRLQDTIPWYRFNNSHHEVIGPSATNEVVETNDPVRSTEMALKNLERVVDLIPEACQEGKDYTRLKRLYENSLELWYNHMRRLVSMIGGYDIHYKSIDQPGNLYTPLDWEAQMEALGFLLEHAFNPPYWLVDPDFDSQFKYSTYPDKLLQYHQSLLFELLRPQRMKRLEYMERISGYQGAFKKYITQLQSGLFNELETGSGKVESRKQEVQLNYIKKLVFIIDGETVNIAATEKAFDYTDYSRGLMMQQLIDLKKEIETGLSKNKFQESMGHWMLCLKKIEDFLKG